MLLIQTNANCERSTEAALMAPHRACRAYFPKILTRRSHARRVDYVERPFIQRYGFVDGDWRTVRSCPGVSCVVTDDGHRDKVRAAADEIRAREYDAINPDGEPVRYVKLDEELQPGARFRPGDAVEVVTLAERGMFKRMDGVYRAIIVLQMFGMARDIVVPLHVLEAA